MNQKFVSWTTYDDETPRAATSLPEDQDWDEYVWHLAPSAEAAAARHQEARDAYEDVEFDYFDHSNPPPGWDHGFDFNISIISRREDASDVTGAEIRAELKKFLDLSDAELLSAANNFSTMREERE